MTSANRLPYGSQTVRCDQVRRWVKRAWRPHPLRLEPALGRLLPHDWPPATAIRRVLRPENRSPRACGPAPLPQQVRRSGSGCDVRCKGGIGDERVQRNPECVVLAAGHFRARLLSPRACRVRAIIRRGGGQRGHHGFVAFELVMRCVEDFLAMTAAHAAVMRREQMRVESENCFAVGAAGSQRHR